MKSRCFYLSAAFIAAAGAVASAAVSMMPVKVYATDITLSPAQTRALLGDTILGSRITGGGSNDLAIATFEFYSYGTVSLQNTVGNRHDTPSGQAQTYTDWNCVGSECVIYRSSDTFIDGSTTNYANHYTVHLNLSTSLYGLSSCRFAYGFSNNEGTMNTSVSRYGNGGVPFINTYVHAVFANSTEEKQYVGYYTNGTWSYYNNFGIICDDPNENRFNATNIQFKKESLSTDILIDNIGVQQCDRVQHPGIGTNSTGFNNYTYFVVVCPMLSDTWYDPNEPGGGDDSSGGSGDLPDYSGDLQDIIDRLDLLIANSQDRFAQLYNINAAINTGNSKLDGVNSRLDTGNSQLYGINSRLDGIKGAIDSLGGGQIDSRPSAGLENSAFDSAAENAFSNIAGMYENSEYKPETQQTGGFLYFVRSFITSGRLTGVFAVVALLMLLRYTIFEKGM